MAPEKSTGTLLKIEPEDRTGAAHLRTPVLQLRYRHARIRTLCSPVL